MKPSVFNHFLAYKKESRTHLETISKTGARQWRAIED